MKILAIDSSSKTISVSILDDYNIIGEIFLDTGLTHSQTLTTMIKNILDFTDNKFDDIDLYAITTGPGSFTGIRIGISVLKGMLLFENKKCIAVSTLLATAYNINFDCYIFCCIEARRNNLYNAIFKYENKNENSDKIIRLTDDKAINLDILINILKDYDDKKVVFVGDGAQICYEYILNKSDIKNIELANKNFMYTKASNVGIAALDIYKKNNLDTRITTADKLLPNYIRLSQAEENLLKKNN